MAYQFLLLEHAERVAIITINRPEKRNALNAAVRRELLAALADMRADPDVRVLVVTGAGSEAFIAGADIGEFASRTAAKQRQALEELELYEGLAGFPKPLIAMINGVALGGGCEVALACDIRIAAETARLGQPEVRLGLIPGGGATQRLPRLTGLGQALRLILSGDLIDARQALAIGLVEEVYPAELLRERTMNLARRLAAHSPLALRLAKSAVRAALEQPLRTGLAQERAAFLEAFDSADGREGVAAFTARRPPRFAGD